MNDEDARESFVIPLRFEDGSYEAFVDEDGDGDEEWVTLQDLKETSQKNNNGRLYNYFLAF